MIASRFFCGLIDKTLAVALSLFVFTLCLLLPISVAKAASDNAFIGQIAFSDLLEIHRHEVEEYYVRGWGLGNLDADFDAVHILYSDDGELLKGNLNTYHLGRALWVFSYLYNHFGNNEQHLKLATTTKNFLFAHMLRDDDMFAEEVTRSGEIVHDIPNIYGDIYIFQGLVEFYRATGDVEARDQAIRTAVTVGERAISPVYLHNYVNHGRAAARAGDFAEFGIQRLGTWQHYLGALTKTLRIISDPRLEIFASIAVERILRVHFDAERGVAWENLPFDGSIPAQLLETGSVSNFHAIQAAWMTMDEGIRRSDRELVSDALVLGNAFVESVLERSRDRVGGYTDDLLVFLLMAYIQTGKSIYADWFNEAWQIGLDDPNWNRRCLLHHPRRLFKTIAVLENVVEMQPLDGPILLFSDGIDSQTRIDNVPSFESWRMFGQGGGRQFIVKVYEDPPRLALTHDGSDVVSQFILRDLWGEDSSSVTAVEIDFIQSIDTASSRFVLRAGQGRVFRNERIHEVVFSDGSINGVANAYSPGQRHRVMVVFNNSESFMPYFDSDLQIAPDSVDIWVDGAPVILGNRLSRGLLPLGSSIESISIDLPSGSMQELSIFGFSVFSGALVDTDKALESERTRMTYSPTSANNLSSGNDGIKFAHLTKSAAAINFREWLHRNGFEDVLVLSDYDSWMKLPKSDSAILHPPNTKLPPELRSNFFETLIRGQSLVMMDPEVYALRPEIVDPVVIFQPSHSSIQLIQPTTSNVNPQPQVNYQIAYDTFLDDMVIQLSTGLIGDGNVFLNIDLSNYSHLDKSVISFSARGEYDADILYMGIMDDAGREWSTFRSLTQQWKEYTVAYDDFLRRDPQTDMAVSGLTVDRVRSLRIGMHRFILWPEVKGAISLSEIKLGKPATSKSFPSGELAEWHVQFERLNINVPRYWRNPFSGASKFSSNEYYLSANLGGDDDIKLPFAGDWLIEAPLPPSERGRENTRLIDIMARDHFFDRPLVHINNRDGNKSAVGFVHRYWHGESLRGAVEIIAPNVPNSPSAHDEWDIFLNDSFDRLHNRPQIVNTKMRTFPFNNDDARPHLMVSVVNPSDKKWKGKVQLSLERFGIMTVEEIFLAENSKSDIKLFVDNPEEIIQWLPLSWRVSLVGEEGKEVDFVSDVINPYLMMAQSVDYFLQLQSLHRGARMSHHFFADIYAVRFLFQFARLLQEDVDFAYRVTSAYGSVDSGRIMNAALIWLDELVALQSDDGSFPMGYGEHRNVRFLGDMGQIAFGIAQITSWLDKNDPRRESYMRFLVNFQNLRQSFFIDEFRLKIIEERFGIDPETTQLGFYGMGFLDSDFFAGGPLEGGLQKEKRGRWWVLPLTMSSVAALSVLDDYPEWRSIAKRDLRNYLEGDFPLNSVTYFHIESLIWMYLTGITDGDDQFIRELSYRFLPMIMNGNTHDGLNFQGRAIIRLLSLLYFERYIESSRRHQSFFLQHLWNLSNTHSSYSLSALAHKYPRTTYGPSIGAFRYNAYAAIWLLELVREGTSLMRD